LLQNRLVAPAVNTPVTHGGHFLKIFKINVSNNLLQILA